MPYEKRSFLEQSYPKVTSDFWNKKADELWQQYKYYDEASQDLRVNIWPECMRAYLCRFDLPENEGLDWPSMSQYHETDIWEGVNFSTDAIVNALLSRDGQYMEMLSMTGEDQSTLNAVRDLMLSIHRRSDLRGHFARHVKQMLIYGTSAIWWQWLEKEVWRSFGPAQTKLKLEAEGIVLSEEELMKSYKKYKFLEPDYVGPVLRTIDMYDLWLDPCGDLAVDRDISLINRFYLNEDDLKDAVDENGEKKYQNLDGIEPQTIEQIFQKDSDERLEMMLEIGISPTLNEGPQGGRLVPVYLFHQPVRRFEEDGSKFIDTFFYVAEATGKGANQAAKIIRVESNPHRNGSRGIYVDTYIDSPGSCAYGIGAVEKSLKAWQSKCVIAELGLAAAMASVFPAYNIVGGYLQDDSEFKIAPGSFNVIRNPGSLGPQNFMAPVPAPIGTVQLGQLSEQWQGSKIQSQLGAMNQVSNQSPTKDIKEARTATEINVQTTSGSMMRDAIIEKITIRCLEPLLQDLYDAARQNLKDPTFERTVDNGSTEVGVVAREKLDIDRRVVATGFRGYINKQQEIQEMQQVIATLSTGQVLAINPNLRMVYQEAVFKLLGRLGMRNLEQYKQDPMTLLMQDPNFAQQIMGLAAQIAGMPPPMPPGPQGQPPPEGMPPDAGQQPTAAA